MKILMLSAEITPFAKTGGLADVVGALPKALHALGHDVRVAMPRYGRIQPAQFNLRRVLDPFPIPFDQRSEEASVLEGELAAGVPAYFIENPSLFQRAEIYMYPDDAERFIFFSRAALEMLKRLNFQPDVIHCHDWHTALIPNWLRTVYAADPFFAATATVFSIHNIQYQGIFGHRVLEIAGLAAHGFIAHPDLAPELNQVFDFMARGILFADKINAVSETYAREIQTPEFGERLDPLLRERRDHLVGILNGIDTERYDPARDPEIAQAYDLHRLDARAANKQALQQASGLPDIPNVPLLGMISRLNDQKGIDLVTGMIEHLLEIYAAQIVLMGTGEERYHDFFTRLQQKHPDRVAIFLTFDERFARKIGAGADMLLMPSRSEPSGSTQMLAMRYGCIPVVRATGGLADSVEDFAWTNRGTGFVFTSPDSWALFAAIARANEVYQFPDRWRALQIRAMSRDFSWNAAAKKYLALYRGAVEVKTLATQTARDRALDLQATNEKLGTLPPRLSRFSDLAYNLWWGWNPSGRRTFQDLDPELWERVGRNAVRFLREMDAGKLRAASQDAAFLKKYDATLAQFDGYQSSKSTWFNATYPRLTDRTIAYLSFEFGLHASLPIYSGGLGILSGDHTKEASDLGLPFVGVGFLYPQGYFTQRLDPDGWQEAVHEKLNFALAPAMPAKDKNGRELMVEVELPGRTVFATLWHIQVGRVPLFLMDTDVEANAPSDRVIAAQLYGGDRERRLIQEYILGIGSVRALRVLGYDPSIWHLNEGHCAFSVLERAREFVQAGMTFQQAQAAVRATTIFTTHTPVPAGNDTFAFDLIERYFADFWKQLGITREQFFDLARQDSVFSMPLLALKSAGASNGVSELHGQVARKMWHFLWHDLPEDAVPIRHVTNGVHSLTWLAPEYHDLFDEYFPPDWRAHLDDPVLWDTVEKIPDERIWSVHCALKNRLMAFVKTRHLPQHGLPENTPGMNRPGFSENQDLANAARLQENALTLGFARRFATYKRAVLMFRDAERLKRILNHPDRPVQILFSGKAHPDDHPGKQFIQQVVRHSREPGFAGRIAFIQDYDINVARYLVQGVDVWLNNPRRPLEASGTSGMKASLNGAPNFSVLDGWWREGFIAGENGWSIGDDQNWDNQDAQDANDADSFYATLENEIAPMFYAREANGVPRDWVRRMKAAIKTIAPRFSTQRMVKEYTRMYYVPAMR